jgi:hypothetical protein
MTADPIAAKGAASTASLGELILALIGDLRASVAARFDIAQIEARQSLGLLLRSLGAACAAVLLVLTAWWAICGVLVVLVVDAGAPRIGALIGAAAVNAALAMWAAHYARQRLTAVGMPNTRRLFLDYKEDAFVRGRQSDASDR